MDGLLQDMCLFLARACTSEEFDERFEVGAATGTVRRMLEQLNAFLDKLWLQSFQLSAKQEMLEKVVEIRTNQVNEILDNVSTGFLLTLRDETILDNFSRSCASIFGTNQLKGRRLSDLMNFSDTRKAHFSLCYEQIFEGLLPPEVSTGQLPGDFSLGDRNYAILGTPILSGDGQVSKVFFSITDTTELRKLEAENALRRALVEIVRQRDAFAEFLRETSQAFEVARRSPSQVKFRSVLHTAKGNLGCYGLHEIAALIHTIEDAPEITHAHLERVEDTIKQFLSAHHAVLGLDYNAPERSGRGSDLVRLRPELEALVLDPDLDARRTRLHDLLLKSTWMEARGLMVPLRATFERVTARLEKEADLDLIGQDVWVDPRRLGAVFSNLGHLIRNSLDHGLESAAERGNKPKRGRVTVACYADDASWTIEVSDDGRGVAVDQVCAAAVARGKITREQLESMGREARLRLIFLDGLTTKEQATLESGRGIGMTALLDAVDAQCGRVDVWTECGVGTQVTIHIPKPTSLPSLLRPAAPAAGRRSREPARP